MKQFINKKLTRKIVFLVVSIPSIMGVLILVVATFLFYKATTKNVSQLDNLLRKDFDRNAKNQVQTVHSLISNIYQEQIDGKLSENQAKTKAADIVRNLKYGTEGYFWIDTKEGDNVVYLGKETEGKNRYDQKDSNGKLFFHEINEKAQEPNGGYTNYWFPKVGETEPSPKRSYSLYFEPYNWVIGTGNYIDDIQELVTAERDKNFHQLLQTVIWLILITLATVALSVFIAIYMGRNITKPIIDMAKAVEDISEGNLHVSVSAIEKDEIGDMGRSMQKMIENLRKLVEKIRDGADNISSASIQVSGSAETIAEGANEQASSTEQISSSMEEMASSISQNSVNALETESIAKSASQNIDKVNSAFNNTLKSLNLITNKISIIHEIAEKTDLLAINASIEAARAGEHGKGFAVVASEVRQLAENCSIAADEIDEISVNTVNVSKESGVLLSELIPEIQKTAALIQEIAAASSEQDLGAQQVNQAIIQLSSVTQQNSAASEQLAAAARNLEVLSFQLKDTISFLVLESDEHSEMENLLDMIAKHNQEIIKIQERIQMKKGNNTATPRPNITENRTKEINEIKKIKDNGTQIDLGDHSDFEQY